MPPKLLSRLRWQVSDVLLPSQDKAAMVRTFIYLYGVGATLVIASLLLPGSPDRWPPGIWGPAVLAYLTTALMLWRFDRLPMWFLYALPPGGCVLVSIVVYAGGADTVTVYATIFFWVVLSAVQFFSLRVALLNIAWVGLCYAALLVSMPGVEQGAIRWLLVMGTLSVLAAVMAALRGRVERLVETLKRRSLKQETVARLGKRALEGAEISELSRITAEAVVTALDVDHAVIFTRAASDGKLLVKTGAGWEGGLLEGSTVSPRDPLLQAALRSPDPVVIANYADRLEDARCGFTTDSAPAESAMAVTVPGPDGPAGVLAAYNREQRSFEATEAAFMQSVAHVLSESIERRRVEEETRHRALHDHLTGRPNRLLFTERLEEALSRTKADDPHVAIFFLDVDDFKLVNDGFGHSAGDELLRALGPRLRRGLVMTDTVARFGGDEFAVLCEDVRDEHHALEIAEQLRDALQEPFTVGGGYRASASIGVAISSGTETAEQLIAQADAAMYLAKEQTRGGYELFDEALQTRAQVRLQFENALRAATEGDQLHLAAQPIVSLPGGAPVGSEVLLRWEHPELGTVSPAEFIPVAEESGAILPIGRWVIARAFELAARWRSEPGFRRYLPLHLNVSARQLAQRDFVAQVSSELARTGARVRDLSFEITEHALIAGDRGTVRTLEELQALGFAIVLDDFGTGYSSLSHLKQFNIDMVKIDRLFVSNLTKERRDEAIITAVIGMADAFALDIVAEGIETPEQAARLTELGCPYGQGFLFARPVPVEEMKPVHHERRRPLQLVERPTADRASSREA